MRSSDTVAVGWIDPGQVDGMFMLSVLAIYRGFRERVQEIHRVESGGLLSKGRNELVARFMNESTCDWLLMLDSDVQLDQRGFDKLVKAAHATERPIVAGLYFAAWPGPLYPTPVPLFLRSIPGTNGFEPIHDYPADKVIDIDGAGAGCVLIHRSVFERIREGASEHEGPDWCWFHDMPVGQHWFAEDLFFFRRAASAGFPIVGHTGVILPHRKRYWLDESHYKALRSAVREVAPA